jgi:site-specific DNA recombinase
LNNDLYNGLVVWNRCRWGHMASDSRNRRVSMNPESQWVKHEDESLRIVSRELWGAAKRRQDEQTKRIGERVARGIEASKASVTGRVGHYLYSCLLRCSECGGIYSLLNNRTYACAGYMNGRICANNRYVKRELLEKILLADIREGLLSAEALQEVERGIRQALRPRTRDGTPAKVAQLEREVGDVVAAIAQVLLSPALRQRLQEVETEIDRLKGVRSRPAWRRCCRSCPRSFAGTSG